jgi:methionyl-tRNA formyltransferase
LRDNPVKVIFLGRKQVSADLLRYLHDLVDVDVIGVVTDSHLSESPTQDEAVRLGIPCYCLEDVCAPGFISATPIDLIVSVLYWRKIPEHFLAAAARGAINFHPAPLPEYKGCGGYNLAILEGREDWAVSAHYMDATIDGGGIIAVDHFPIDPDRELAVTLERKSMKMLYAQAVRVLNAAIASQELLPVAPNVGGTYTSRAKMEALKEVGPEDDVDRKVRAFWFPPYDGAYLTVGGTRFTLVNRGILETLGDPGSSSLFTPRATPGRT